MSKVAEETKTETAVSLAPPSQTPVKAPKLRYVPLKGGQGVVGVDSALPFSPDQSAGGELPPMADWQEPGDTAWGQLIRVDEKIGPNESRVYHLGHPNGTVIGVWGTTIMDQAFDRLSPTSGDLVAFTYLGEVPTKRAQNPALLFRVSVKRRDGSQASAK